MFQTRSKRLQSRSTTDEEVREIVSPTQR